MDSGNLVVPERVIVAFGLVVKRPQSLEKQVPLLALWVHELGDILSRVDTRLLGEAGDEILLGCHRDSPRSLLLFGVGSGNYTVDVYLLRVNVGFAQEYIGASQAFQTSLLSKKRLMDVQEASHPPAQTATNWLMQWPS